MNKFLFAVAPVMFLVWAACSGNPPKPATTAADKTATPTDTSTPAPSNTAAGEADAAAPATSATAKPKSTGSGRPVAIYVDATQPTTVGLDGAVFRTSDGGELRIPNGWYRESRNILFMVDKGQKGTTGRIGKSYEIHVQRPEVEFRIGEETPSETIPTQSDPFVVKLPLPAGVNSGNLAIETVTADPKTKRNKSTWAVVAQTKMETSDSGNRAVFEIQVLPDGRIHLTTNPASAAPAP